MWRTSSSKSIYDLHLRTISTNEPHPKAPLPILSCLDRHPTIPPPPEPFAAVRVQVSGDLVGLLIKEAPDPVGAHLEIWNWENDPYFSVRISLLLEQYLTDIPSYDNARLVLNGRTTRDRRFHFPFAFFIPDRTSRRPLRSLYLSGATDISLSTFGTGA